MKTLVQSAIFTQYNKARSCGKLDIDRCNRALGLIQHKEQRPYDTTLKSCTCPDFLNTGKACKHMIFKMICQRAFENLLEKIDNLVITTAVFIEGEIFPIETSTAHEIAQKNNFTPRPIFGGLAYRKSA